MSYANGYMAGLSGGGAMVGTSLMPDSRNESSCACGEQTHDYCGTAPALPSARPRFVVIGIEPLIKG